jgi:hypothetical protein
MLRLVDRGAPAFRNWSANDPGVGSRSGNSRGLGRPVNRLISFLQFSSIGQSQRDSSQRRRNKNRRQIGGRIKKVMIVALARKLLVALEHYVKDGVRALGYCRPDAIALSRETSCMLDSLTISAASCSGVQRGAACGWARTGG